MKKSITSFITTVLITASTTTLTPINSPAQTQQVQPIRIPLEMTQLRAGTYKANLEIGIGNLQPLPFVLDTGSTGLHVFAAEHLDAPGSGAQCTQQPISFTAGNPGKITYTGIVCYAPLHLGGRITPPVPIAYLTSVSCTENNPDCKLPDVNNPKDHGNVYGVFGAGITGAMPVPAPILSLPAPYSSSYSIRLTPNAGELVLGVGAPANAVQFPLTHGNKEGVRWDKGLACIFVNGQVTNTCLAISFDTGNGVAWIRDDAAASVIPARGAEVRPGTRIGFGPQGVKQEAFDLEAGNTFATKIKIMPQKGAALTNVGIEAFFNHTITYDNINGVISIAPLN